MQAHQQAQSIAQTQNQTQQQTQVFGQAQSCAQTPARVLAQVQSLVDHIYLWCLRFAQVFQQAFQQAFEVTRGVVGVEHLKAIVEVMDVDSMPSLVNEFLRALFLIKLQSAVYDVLAGVYGYCDLVLEYIKSYPALHEGVYVFALLRMQFVYYK